MRAQHAKILIATLSLACLTACGKANTAQDLNSGQSKPRDCVEQLDENQSYRGSFTISQSTTLDVPTRNIRSGSKRVVKLYNHKTCDSALETDYFYQTDSYFSINGDTSGLESTTGDNRIDFEVQECRKIDTANGIKCIGELAKDAGYFMLRVDPKN